MPVDACLLQKARAGRLSEARAQEFIDELEARQAEGAENLDAAIQVLKAAQRRAANRKRQKLLLAQRQIQIGKRMDAVESVSDKAAVAKSHLHFDEKGRFGGENVATTEQFIHGQTLALMADFIENARSKAAGLRGAGRDKARMRDIVRALHGEQVTDQEAARLARGISEGFEFQRRLFNEAGGDIAKREDFGLPHLHNREVIASVSREEYIDFLLPKLNRESLVDLDSGARLSDAQAREVLSSAYDNIIDNGLGDVVPEENGFQVRRSVSNTRQESRVLQFRDADAWFEYQNRFGHGNTFDIIMNHVRGMSRDIALMKVLGPNPDATIKFMKRKIDRARADQAKELTGAAAVRNLRRNPSASLDALYAEVSGNSLTPDNELFANIGGSVRSLTVASNLGGAFLSAITDVGFTGTTAAFNGFSGTKVVGRLLKTFVTAGQTDRLAALRSGFNVDTWTQTMAAQQRFSIDELGAQWTRQVADVVLRASFLSAWTEAGKVAFQKEFLGFVTDNVGKTFGQLPDPMKRAFRRHGVTSAEWDLARGTTLATDDNGVKFLHLGGMAASGDAAQFQAASKIQGMILNESKFAVPEATAKTRALLTGGNKPGSLMGEMLRSAVLFKTFPVTILQNHIWGRLLNDAQTTTAQKMAYGASVFTAMTVMGAMAIQLKDMAKGRDPRPMGTAQFWGAALQQGGGLGVLGDFLFSDHNRFGGSLTNWIAGPIFGGVADKGVRLVAGNTQELITEGEARNLGPEMISFARSLTPGQNLWYTRLAFERAVLDKLQQAVDPDYAARFRRIQQRAERDYGAGFFAPPGQGIERAPDISNAFRSGP